MKNQISYKLIACLLIISQTFNLFAQTEDSQYERPLTVHADVWQKIVIPNEILDKLNPNLSDIRIYGINETTDTVEVPYLWRISKEKFKTTDVDFELINRSRNDNSFFYTFKLNELSIINEITLDFRRDNFDWYVKLEGSNDQLDWFLIDDKLRILSINNEHTSYNYTKLSFGNTEYSYYRIQIDSDKTPWLRRSKIKIKSREHGTYRKYKVQSIQQVEDSDSKQSIVYASIGQHLPISYVKLFVKDTFDYYRPIQVDFLRDSVQTPAGVHYDYTYFDSGLLSSLDENVYTNTSVKTKQLRISIDNDDNIPLQIDSIAVKGYLYELIVRLPDATSYFMTYGNSELTHPNYDIVKFTDKIPDELFEIHIGDIQTSKTDESSITTKALFENSIWLWAIMLAIIALIAFLTIKMLRQKSSDK